MINPEGYPETLVNSGSNTKQEITRLTRNRGSIKQKLTILEKFGNTIKTPDTKPSLNDVQLRYTNGTSLLKEFDNIQSIIESICEEGDLPTQFKEREEFENKYYLILDFLLQYINNEIKVDQPSNSTSLQVSQASDSLHNVLLPKLKLPTFSGNFEHWLNFKVNFTSIITNNATITNSQKYQFLKASLVGYASRLIEGLESVEQPYEKAWKILNDKFDKKQFLLDTHFQQLFTVQQLNKENFYSFSQMLDVVTKHLTAIENMSLSHESLYDSLLIHLLSSKLDRTTLREWKELEFESELPSLEEFLKFFKNKVDLLQSLEQSYSLKPQHSFNSSKPVSQKVYKPSQIHLAVANDNISTIKCNFCNQNHSIYKCQDFLALSIKERIENVKRLNLCQNCLRTGHSFDKCTLNSCRICKSKNRILKHNSLLHIDFKREIKENDGEAPSDLNMLVRQSFNCQSQVLLSTIVCKVKDSQGNFHQCRALLDCGAQSNLITQELCDKLNIPCIPTKLSIIGINQVISKLNKKCSVSLFSNYSEFNCTISCFVAPIITTNIPLHPINISNWSLPKEAQLADPGFYTSSTVDLLIGANLFWNLILDGKIILGNNFPTLQNSRFGYIVTGSTPIELNYTSLCNFSKVIIPEDEQLKRFWEIEEIHGNIPLSKDDLECEKQFETNTIRNDQGQFVVKFPLKHPSSMLGDSKDTALKRFMSLEKRFADPHFKKLYFDFIHEYESLGHMTKISDQNASISNSISYFLPHHGVLKETSITTKLRTVFDGSCPSSTGWSLNDIQYVGPKVQNDILDILLRFRTYVYVVSADISKMYRCVLMHPDHRQLQQILWRESLNDDISTYQLNTVSYGTSSAPYLSIKCIKLLAKENSDQFPEACQTIINDIYVDDLLTGSNNPSELKLKCTQIYSILKSAQFILRKWVSNDPQIITDFDHENISNSTLNFDKNESCKTLGVQWLPSPDNLKYSIRQFPHNSTPITKRYILSTIAQIYDPLGLLSPIIITSKIILQRLWSLKISWDSIIPPNVEKSFLQFQNNLSQLNNLHIPRNTIPKDHTLVDIHCFCDASKEAYAACVYMRSKDVHDNFTIHLLCAKSKVAPLKTISIPKLELCASLLGTQLIDKVKYALSSSFPIFMWSDSQVVLNWIKTEPSQLQVFVSNRVSKIQSMSDIDSWRYVNTKENPADLASRGVSTEKLINSSFWWLGPRFLEKPSSYWPEDNYLIPTNYLPELRKSATIFKSGNFEHFFLFTKFSSFIKLQRITALCIRFFNNLRNKRNNKNITTGFISVTELQNANLILIRLTQSECFKMEFNLLSKSPNLDKNHKLSSLTPFIDNQYIIRVGGRLKNTYLPYSTKHPVLLQSSHPFTKLLFEHKHKCLLHPGPQLLLASIRQFYWPIGGRNLAKKTIKNCLTCFKFNPKPFVCPMSTLPDNRINPSYPFQVTGLDYAGPFFILNKPGRGAKLIKCYLAVFVCFSTKAVHLEVVTSLTTDNFLLCFKRFVSRRGLPSQIYSDNGSTFIGANNELKELGNFLQKNQERIVDATSQDNVNWVFIPPYSPNFGGLWEAAIKSSKHHLKRVLINRNVTFEEFNTIVIQVEGILNSRPLFSMSNDPNDLIPITPSHFLIGRPLNFIPEHNLQDINFNKLSRVQHTQRLCQQFWTQFSKHYIAQLHSQYKWKEAPSKIDTGVLVLLKNDKKPPYLWPLGRINKVLPSKDGVSRVAEVITKTGVVVRSTRHLCPLPFQEETEH